MSARAVSVSVLVLAVFTAAACGRDESAMPTPKTVPATADSGHAHEAPHGGTLVELGDHFGFLELVLDAEAGSLTTYVLDGAAEQAVRVAQPSIDVVFDSPSGLAGRTLQLTGRANVLTGETAGDTSEFVVAHDSLKGQSAFTARVVEVHVKGQTFRDLTVIRQP